jgi:hypothetical protein
LPALCVYHLAASVFRQSSRESNPERAFFRVSELELPKCVNADVEVDNPQFVIGVKRKSSGLRHHRLSLGIEAIEDRLNRSGLPSPFGLEHFPQHHSAFIGGWDIGLSGPEIDSVYITVAEKHASMVRMIIRLAIEWFHGKVARHDNTRGRPKRIDIGFVSVWRKEEIGIRLAIDLHRDAICSPRYFHLCIQ